MNEVDSHTACHLVRSCGPTALNNRCPPPRATRAPGNTASLCSAASGT